VSCQQVPPKVGVIGLGYVGLPVAAAFAKHYPVIGYDINSKRIEELLQGYDRNHEVPSDALQNPNLTFTADLEKLREANFFIVTVPTPIDIYKVPDLTPLRKASEALAQILKKGDTVVYESTVYPGCTEEVCIPILEQSGLKAGEDFWVGYSPERINPGDPQHPFEKIPKVVSGIHPEALAYIAEVYQRVLEAPIHKAPSIKVAEAAKVIENTQRDLNIALINELALLFHEMGLSVYDVLEAAATKWNFHRYTPGLVGGHCIGVDPYYLTYKAAGIGFHPQLILAGRRVNDEMPRRLAEMLLQNLAQSQHPTPWHILILGFTFKEDVPDIRNTKVYDLYLTLRNHGAQVEVHDPLAHPEEVAEEYGITLTEPRPHAYHALVLAVPHKPYLALSQKDFEAWAKPHALFVDIKGKFRCRIHEPLQYWTL
jgi:UDP-N-acetyl-D-glucosamine/UDP-N-acetyl-D-galactosamine dehydrogenase